MTVTEFIDLVTKMRTAQMEYFKWKNTNDLRRAMRLENEVDQILKSKFVTNQPATNQLSIESFL